MSSAPVSGSGRAREISEWFGALVEHHRATAAAEGESMAELAVGRVPIRFHFAGSRLRPFLFPALAHHPQARSEPAFTILIYDSRPGAAPVPAFPFRLEDVGAKGEVAAATTESIRTTWFIGSRMLSVIDLERKVAICWTPDAATLPWYERAAPLRTLLHWILAASGRNLVHAAAVSLPSGRGALLAGRGGSGKSTTAMLCLAAGFHYAGDDYVVVSADQGQAEAHSLYGSAKLTANSLEWLPFLRSGVQGDAADGEKTVVMLGDVIPERMVDSFGVAALIVPHVSAAPRSTLRRSTAAASLRALAPTTIFQLPGSSGATFEQLASFTRAIPAWSLELGADRDDIPALVAQAIEAG